MSPLKNWKPYWSSLERQEDENNLRMFFDEFVHGVYGAKVGSQEYVKLKSILNLTSGIAQLRSMFKNWWVDRYFKKTRQYLDDVGIFCSPEFIRVRSKYLKLKGIKINQYETPTLDILENKIKLKVQSQNRSYTKDEQDMLDTIINIRKLTKEQLDKKTRTNKSRAINKVNKNLLQKP